MVTHNLTRHLKPLVGRAPELGILDQLIQGGAAQVYGPMGQGKTHLALTWARAQADAGRWSELWCCPLRTCHHADDLARAVASTLHLPDNQCVARALASRGRLLLLLDACEGLDEEAQALLASWRSTCPDLSVLLTSRVALPSHEAASLALQPLPRHHAEALFWSRSALMPSTDAEEALFMEATRELVSWLGGHPLSLELAATAIGLYQQTRHALHSLLTWEGSGGSPSSLEVVLRWRIQLLNTAQRELLQATALFVASFDLTQAQALYQGSDDDTRQGLAALARLGLLEEEPQARWRMQAAVADFVQARSSREELTRLTQRMARHYLDREGDPQRLTRDVRVSMAATHRIWQEQEELFALYHRLTRCDLPLATQLGLLLCRALSNHSPQPLNAISAQCLDAATRDGDEDTLFQARMACMLLLYAQDKDIGTLQELLSAMEAQLARQPNPLHRAQLSYQQGFYTLMQGSYDEAQRHLTVALEYAQQHDLHTLEILTWQQLAYLALVKARYGDCARCFQRAQALVEQHALPDLTLVQLIGRAELATVQGSAEEALALYQAALDLYAPLGSSRNLSLTHYLLGYLLYGLGRTDQANKHLLLSHDIERRIGGGWTDAHGLIMRALLHTERDEPADAEALRREAIQKKGNTRNQWWLHAISALILCIHGHPEEAQASRVARDQLLRRTFPDEGAPWACALFDLLGDLEWSPRDAPLSLDQRDRLEALLAQEAAMDSTSASLRVLFAGLRRLWAPKLRHAALEPSVLGPGQEDNPSGGAPPLLWISDAGDRFRWQSQPVVSLARRAAMRRLLAALAQQHQEWPGEPLELAQLFEAGWPGQRALPASRDARVYNAISRLRKLGLAQALVHNGEGYALLATLRLTRGDAN